MELGRSERRARDVKRWLVDNGCFSDPNRVLYKEQTKDIIIILQQSDTGFTPTVMMTRRLLSSRDYSRRAK